MDVSARPEFGGVTRTVHSRVGHQRCRQRPRRPVLSDLPFAGTARAIELLATEVLPVVRRETALKQVARRASGPSADGGENAARRPDQGNDVAMTRSHHIRHPRAARVDHHRPKAS